MTIEVKVRPNGHLEIRRGDKVAVISHADTVAELKKAFGLTNN